MATRTGRMLDRVDSGTAEYCDTDSVTHLRVYRGWGDRRWSIDGASEGGKNFTRAVWYRATFEEAIKTLPSFAACYTPHLLQRRNPMNTTSPDELRVKVGDHFYASWGYDQTNVNFYEVVKLTPKGVKLRPVRSRVKDGKGLVPVPGAFTGSEFAVRVNPGFRSGVSVSSPTYIAGGGYASSWDGKPQYDTIALGYAGH